MGATRERKSVFDSLHTELCSRFSFCSLACFACFLWHIIAHRELHGLSVGVFTILFFLRAHNHFFLACIYMKLSVFTIDPFLLLASFRASQSILARWHYIWTKDAVCESFFFAVWGAFYRFSIRKCVEI